MTTTSPCPCRWHSNWCMAGASTKSPVSCLQFHRSEDLPAARARLLALIHDHQLELETRDFAELTPFYGQAKGCFSAIFLFIALVMGVIVLFAVVNTMTMNVMERTNEIGTIRAMGVRRNGIRAQFVAEGSLIGAIGATVGAALAFAIAALVNHAHLTWVPPGNADPVPLQVAVTSSVSLVIGAWIGTRPGRNDCRVGARQRCGTTFNSRCPTACMRGSWS